MPIQVTRIGMKWLTAACHAAIVQWFAQPVFVPRLRIRPTLQTKHAERWSKWDSCFSLDFSYIHGGPVRSTVRSRYRQWMTHKLASWIDQFGTSGCVGCGRCITWCPVGIDITEEVAAIRNNQTEKTNSI